MNYADYHLHSEFSCDAHEPIEFICNKAVSEGVEEICITDHCEFPLQDKYPWPDFKKREEVINAFRERYEGKLTILSGVELGQAWNEVPRLDDLLKENDFDFCLGSVHALDGVNDMSHMGINEDNYREYFEEYIRQLELTVKTTDFDVMGHITYFFKPFNADFIKRYPPESFRKDYTELLDLIASNGKGIEINCSGLRIPGLQNTMPSEEIIRWFRLCGGKIVTVGSDGHSRYSACRNIPEGYKVLKKAGFDKITRYRKREPYFVEI
ncbi:MAG: histidinol-phosphatase HisJ family protein [Eubacteriales bacterium]|nr:histidinol-phosphatase HisJ family protein [Eubacteriales bacterium]